MKTLTINTPDDWHVHLRDHTTLKHTANATAAHFNKALIMPNLVKPLTTIQMLCDYRARILNCTTKYSQFNPLMTFYLNSEVTVEELILAKYHPYIVGGKLYPAGVTTNSSAGVTSLRVLYPQFKIMEEQHLVLQIHGESREGDIFERENHFIERELTQIINDFPKLRIVLEHISTKKAVEFVNHAPETVAATITPHHLLYNRNHMLAGGIRPHLYCLPILKTATDQQALLEAAVSGNPKFFAGTDSAPHLRQFKETACGCAGIYSAPYAIAIYAQLFHEQNQLLKLNNFLSCFGSEFYNFPVNKTQICLVEKSQLIPNKLDFDDDEIIPIAAGETVSWSIDEGI